MSPLVRIIWCFFLFNLPLASSRTEGIDPPLFNSLNDGTGTTVTSFLYNGRYGVQTDANGLLHMRARYYNPYLCRFINADPSGFAGGLNLYAFADGNPVGMIDPFGLGALAVNGQSWMPPNPLLEKMLSPKLTLTDILGGLFNVAGSVANIPWTMAEGLGIEIIKTAVGEDANGNSISTGQRVFAGAMLAANLIPATSITRTLGSAARTEILFGQASVSSTFSEGAYLGRSIGEVAQGLRAGTISPNTLPIDYVIRNGQSVTLNNRSLLALRRARVEPTITRNLTGNQTAERLLSRHLRGGMPSDVIRVRGGPSGTSLID